MDPHAQAALLACALGVLVVAGFAWRVWIGVRMRSARKQRELALPEQTAEGDGQPMRARDMRAADIEQVLLLGMDDLHRPL